MSSSDPRYLIRVLEELYSNAARWQSVARDTQAEADYQQALSAEALAATVRRSSLAQTQAENDDEMIREAEYEVEEARERSVEIHAEVKITLERGDQARDLAQRTLQKWQYELQKALEWLKRARERLREAIAAYDAAKRVLATRLYELNVAISRLNDCRRESNRNCNSLERAVSNLRQEVSFAERQVEVAAREVQAAEEEVARAEARVACCQKAVAIAEKAVDKATEALDQGEFALAQAERGGESAESASRFIKEARRNVDNELDAVEQAGVITHRARETEETAKQSLLSARDHNADAQRYLTEGRNELDYRIQSLRELNRVEGLPVGGRTATSISVDIPNAIELGKKEIQRQARYLNKMQGEIGEGLAVAVLSQELDLTPDTRFEPTKHGFDMVFRENGRPVVVESKFDERGIRALKGDQMQPHWIARCVELMQVIGKPGYYSPENARIAEEISALGIENIRRLVLTTDPRSLDIVCYEGNPDGTWQQIAMWSALDFQLPLDEQ